MTKAKTETPEDQTPAVDTTQDAPIPAPETPAGEGADNSDLDALEAAAAAAKAAAEAEADAKHQRMVRAKAEKDAKAAARAAARSEADREDRLEQLKDLLTVIEIGNTASIETRDALVEDLAAHHEALLDDEIFSLADITVLRAGTLERTLADWAMEARRQIMALT